ncbi:hypothetical protein RD055328_05550 [Companilactobacillus sp. RD055328]|nr:hypothetical protein [Companilactobacillus sp. RD055328]GKQ42632.1 hypothetical protein RD055328_05550 [Companilactobacillus sp. RD055328]
MKELLDFLWNTTWWQFSLSAIVIIALVSSLIGSGFKHYRKH